MSLLICFSLAGFFLAIPNNLFSFVTLNRRRCLRNGIGHYLLCLSCVNQTCLALLSARLIHLTLTSSLLESRPTIDHLLCKVLSYLLTCISRVAYWLSSFVALERLYTAVFLRDRWLKQPRIARRLIGLTFGIIFLSTSYELVLIKSFSSAEEGTGVMCVIEFPIQHQSLSIFIHQIISIISFLLPLLINISCTLTIMSVVVRTKMNIHLPTACKLMFNAAILSANEI